MRLLLREHLHGVHLHGEAVFQKEGLGLFRMLHASMYMSLRSRSPWYPFG